MVEYWISKIHLTKVSLDYNLVYRSARNHFWGGSLSGGLLLGQSALIMRDVLGILPPDTIIDRVPISPDQIYMYLSRGPLVVGHAIHSGWKPRFLSEFGAIDESFEPERNAGHAVALFGLNRKNNVYHYVFLNSWGKDYGRMKGLVAMTISHSIKCQLDRPVSIVPGKMFAEWGGFKKYLMGKT